MEDMLFRAGRRLGGADFTSMLCVVLDQPAVGVNAKKGVSAGQFRTEPYRTWNRVGIGLEGWQRRG